MHEVPFPGYLLTVLNTNKFGSHLRNSCRRLRIVHISPEVAQVSHSKQLFLPEFLQIFRLHSLYYFEEGSKQYWGR